MTHRQERTHQSALFRLWLILFHCLLTGANFAEPLSVFLALLAGGDMEGSALKGCPLGALSLQLRQSHVERTDAPRLLAGLLHDGLSRWGPIEYPLALRNASGAPTPSCWEEPSARREMFSQRLHGYVCLGTSGFFLRLHGI